MKVTKGNTKKTKQRWFHALKDTYKSYFGSESAWTIGEERTLSQVSMCRYGYHASPTIMDVLDYYDFGPIITEVELGELKWDDDEEKKHYSPTSVEGSEGCKVVSKSRKLVAAADVRDVIAALRGEKRFHYRDETYGAIDDIVAAVDSVVAWAAEAKKEAAKLRALSQKAGNFEEILAIAESLASDTDEIDYTARELNNAYDRLDDYSDNWKDDVDAILTGRDEDITAQELIDAIDKALKASKRKAAKK